jgi:hypothetical protein
MPHICYVIEKLEEAQIDKIMTYFFGTLPKGETVEVRRKTIQEVIQYSYKQGRNADLIKLKEKETQNG